MFPISAEAIYTIQFSMFFAFCALCFLSIAKSKLFALLPLGTYVAYSVWSLMNSGGGYDGLGQLILVVFLLIILVVGGLWALTLHFGSRWISSRKKIKIWKGTTQFLAAFPAIIISIFAINQQYIPNSTCTNEGIKIIVGGEEYALLREYNSMLRMEAADPQSGTQFHYSYEPEHKKDLVSICGLSEGGHTPISVGQLWIEPKGLQSTYRDFCDSRSGMAGQMCTEYSNLEWSHIGKIMLVERPKFTDYLYGLPYFEVHNITELKKEPDVLAEGDPKAGYICRKSIHPTVEGNYCYAWRNVGNNTIFTGRTKAIVGSVPEELLRTLNVAMDFAILKISQ